MWLPSLILIPFFLSPFHKKLNSFGQTGLLNRPSTPNPYILGNWPSIAYIIRTKLEIIFIGWNPVCTATLGRVHDVISCESFSTNKTLLTIHTLGPEVPIESLSLWENHWKLQDGGEVCNCWKLPLLGWLYQQWHFLEMKNPPHPTKPSRFPTGTYRRNRGKSTVFLAL